MSEDSFRVFLNQRNNLVLFDFEVTAMKTVFVYFTDDFERVKIENVISCKTETDVLEVTSQNEIFYLPLTHVHHWVVYESPETEQC